MVEDIVKSFGYLTLGTRLRRIGERLQADTQQIIEEAGLPIQTAHFPVMAAIDRLGPLTIGELAQAVGISQPGVTRSVSQLVHLGYVDLNPTVEDQRRKLASLTVQGQDFIDHSKRAVWPRIGEAVAEVCDGLSGPLLDQLAAIETALAEAPLARRGSSRDPISGPEAPAIRKQKP